MVWMDQSLDDGRSVMAPTDSRPHYEQMRTLEDAAADNLEDYVLAYGKVAPRLEHAVPTRRLRRRTLTGNGSPLTTVKGTGRGPVGA